MKVKLTASTVGVLIVSVIGSCHAQVQTTLQQELERMKKMDPQTRLGYAAAASHPIKEFYVYKNSSGRQIYQVTSDQAPNVYNTPQLRPGESSQDYMKRLQAAVDRQLALVKAANGDFSGAPNRPTSNGTQPSSYQQSRSAGAVQVGGMWRLANGQYVAMTQDELKAHATPVGGLWHLPNGQYLSMTQSELIDHATVVGELLRLPNGQYLSRKGTGR
jgi:hypothetical protein